VAHDGGGSQGSLVGLAPVDKSFSRIATRSLTSAVKLPTRATTDRYLGRQFMVVVMVFTINISGGYCGPRFGIP
jgi:hypothetical protein